MELFEIDLFDPLTVDKRLMFDCIDSELETI